MAILVLVLLFVVAVAAIAYPLLARQAFTAPAGAVTERDVERAVRQLRDARRGAHHCPTCGHPYLAGDRFCVKCGADLPADVPAPQPADLGTCPECGAPLRAGDVFCSKCGHRVAAGEEH